MASLAENVVRVIQNIFELRDFSKEGILGTPKQVKTRFRLVRGLLRDVPKGKLTAGTLKDLQDVVIDAIKASPFLREPRGSEHN